MSQIYYGIDLGTSNSSISYIAESPRSAKSPFVEPTTVKFNPPPGASFFHNWQRFPSMLYIARKGKSFKCVAGFLAEIEAGERRAKPFENIFMSAKSDIMGLRGHIFICHYFPFLFAPSNTPSPFNCSVSWLWCRVYTISLPSSFNCSDVLH